MYRNTFAYGGGLKICFLTFRLRYKLLLASYQIPFSPSRGAFSRFEEVTGFIFLSIVLYIKYKVHESTPYIILSRRQEDNSSVGEVEG